MATILTLDDDKNLQTVLSHHLEQDGYKVFCLSNGADLLENVDKLNPDIVLLDLGLPDKNGLDLIAAIRDKSKAGIIIVSGKTDAVDRIVGLEMGADDYLPKPFAMRELSARIRALLRRTADAVPATPDKLGHLRLDQCLFFNGLCLDCDRYQVFDKDNVSLELTSGEFRLLESLVRAPHRVLSREHLFELTRKEGGFDSSDRAIDIQIARIRKKINDSPQSPTLIKTVRGVGYMFCGEVKNTST